MDELWEFFRGEEARRCRRAFSRVGWAMAAFLLLQLLAQYPLILLLQALAPAWLESGAAGYLIAAVATYAVAFPVSMLILLTVPAQGPQPGETLTAGSMVSLWLLCLGCVYASNMLGLFLVEGVSSAAGREIANPVETVMEQQPVLLNLVLTCVLAPMAEELLFRKGLIDRLLPWGEGFAVVASSLLFAIAHANLYQFTYALCVGVVLGGVYLRTGRLAYTVVLHGGINFISAGLLPLANLAGDAGLTALSLLVLFSISWAVQWIFHRREAIGEALRTAAWGDGELWGHLLVNFGTTTFCLAALWVLMRYIYM